MLVILASAWVLYLLPFYWPDEVTCAFRTIGRRNHLSEISPTEHDGHSTLGQEEWTGGARSRVRPPALECALRPLMGWAGGLGAQTGGVTPYPSSLAIEFETPGRICCTDKKTEVWSKETTCPNSDSWQTQNQSHPNLQLYKFLGEK